MSLYRCEVKRSRPCPPNLRTTSILMKQLSQRSAEREALAVRMAASAASATLSRDQIAAITAELGAIANALQPATAEERVAIYGTLDSRLDYDDRTNQVQATSNLARVANRVGGGLDGLLPSRAVHRRSRAMATSGVTGTISWYQPFEVSRCLATNQPRWQAELSKERRRPWTIKH